MIEWDKTIAARCRWSGMVRELLREKLGSDFMVIWEDSYDDYQGSAEVFLAAENGKFAHYQWTYGSCSGCDSWEDQCDADYTAEGPDVKYTPSQAVRDEVMNGIGVLTNEEHFVDYLVGIDRTDPQKAESIIRAWRCC